VVLRDVADGTDVFRVTGPPGAPARVAFAGTGGLLLARWESEGGGRVDVWGV
jgi:hypothetical protein